MVEDQKNSLENLFPLSDIAEYAGTTPDYLRYLIFKKKLRGHKIGKIWFTKKEWVDEHKKSLLKSTLLETEKLALSNDNNVSVVEKKPDDFSDIRDIRLPSKDTQPQLKLRFAPAFALTIMVILGGVFISQTNHQNQLTDRSANYVADQNKVEIKHQVLPLTEVDWQKIVSNLKAPQDIKDIIKAPSRKVAATPIPHVALPSLPSLSFNMPSFSPVFKALLSPAKKIVSVIGHTKDALFTSIYKLAERPHYSTKISSQAAKEPLGHAKISFYDPIQSVKMFVYE